MAKNSWLWNNQTRAWEELGDEYLKPITRCYSNGT